MRMSPKARMNRLFANGRCLDVAIDHGVCNEPSFMAGLEDIGGVVDQLVAAGPDAIQMNYGQADLLQSRPGEGQAGAGHAHRHGQPLQRQPPPRDVGRAAERATSRSSARCEMDAACVVVNLFMLPDEPDLFRQCVANIAATRAACATYGMPLMIEPLVMLPNDVRGGYQVDGDAEKIVHAGAARRRDGRRHHQGRPDRPMPRISTAWSRRRACRCWCAAAARKICAPCSTSPRRCWRRARMGLVYGRNIYQHDNPEARGRGADGDDPPRRLGRRGLGDLPAVAETPASCSASMPATPSSRRCCSTATGASSRRASATAPRCTPAPGHVERDLDELWANAAAVIRDCLDKAGVEPRRDRGGRLRRPWQRALPASTAPARRCSRIQSLDSRAAALAEELRADGNGARLHAICLQEPWPSQTPTLLAWVRAPRAGDLRRARHGVLLQGLRHLPPDRRAASPTSPT